MSNLIENKISFTQNNQDQAKNKSNIIKCYLKQMNQNKIIEYNTHNINDSQISFIQIEALQKKQLSSIDIIWIFHIKKDYIKMCSSPNTLRKYGNYLKPTSKRQYIQICSLFKYINRKQSQLGVIIKLQKDLSIVLQARIQSGEYYSQYNVIFEIMKSNMIKMKRILNQYFYKIITYVNFEIQTNSESLQQKNKDQTLQLEKQSSQQKLKLFRQLFQNYRQNQWKVQQFDGSLNRQTYNKYMENIKSILLISKLKQYKKNQFRQQTTFQMNLGFQKASNDSQKEKKSQNILNKNQSNIYPIQILKVIKEKQYSHNGGHSQIIMGKYQFLQNKSVNKNVNLAIGKNNFKKTKELVKKISLNKQISKKLFNNQKNFLLYMRGKNCANIASYYIQEFQQIQDLKCIYLQKYKKDLWDIINKGILSISSKLRISLGILEGITFLANNWIVHRDLKPANIMIDQKFNPKIIDFGSCCNVYGYQEFFPNHYNSLFSTRSYHLQHSQLPQTIKNQININEYNQHILFDIYSFGRILLDLLQQSNQQLSKMEKYSTYGYLYYVIKKCQEQNPFDRISHQELRVFLQQICQIAH